MIHENTSRQHYDALCLQSAGSVMVFLQPLQKRTVLNEAIRGSLSAQRLREFDELVRLSVAQRKLAIHLEHMPEVVACDHPGQCVVKRCFELMHHLLIIHDAKKFLGQERAELFDGNISTAIRINGIDEELD